MLSTEGQRVPVDQFSVDLSVLPKAQQPVFRKLEIVAALGGQLYLAQINNLKPDRDQSVLKASEDPLATDPLTLPDKDGRFVSLWKHPDQYPLLLEARKELLFAAQLSEIAGNIELARYLNSAGTQLVTGKYDAVTGRYLQLRDPHINFHLLPFENQYGKKVWEGYVGIIDQADSEELMEEVRELRKVGAEKNGGKWFSPQTNVSVDNVAVMSGWLASWARMLRRREEGLSGEGKISAQNLPNENYLVRRYGSRIILYAASFQEAYAEIAENSELYLDPELRPSSVDAATFLIGHEFRHDERYDNDLGWLHSPFRELFATAGCLESYADTWLERNPERFRSAIEGCLGYSLLDCSSVFGQVTLSNLETMVKQSVYLPGSLALLHLGIIGEAWVVENGKIVSIDLQKTAFLARNLISKQRDLLSQGSVMKVEKYFNDILPREPLPFGKLARTR